MALVMLLYPDAGDCLGLDANRSFAKCCLNFCKTMVLSQTIFATRHQIPRNASVRPLRMYFQ